jgi:hypothetical protein
LFPLFFTIFFIFLSFLLLFPLSSIHHSREVELDRAIDKLLGQTVASVVAGQEHHASQPSARAGLGLGALYQGSTVYMARLKEAQHGSVEQQQEKKT